MDTSRTVPGDMVHAVDVAISPMSIVSDPAGASVVPSIVMAVVPTGIFSMHLVHSESDFRRRRSQSRTSAPQQDPGCKQHMT